MSAVGEVKEAKLKIRLLGRFEVWREDQLLDSQAWGAIARLSSCSKSCSLNEAKFSPKTG